MQAVKRLQAQHRLILTGTPIQNSVLELWSLFDFLMPGFLGGAWAQDKGVARGEERGPEGCSNRDAGAVGCLPASHHTSIPLSPSPP